MNDFRWACSIEDGDSVVITGGEDDITRKSFVSRFRQLLSLSVSAKSEVVRYTTSGWQEDLPRMTQMRSHHACSSYVGEDGEKVTGSQD